MRRLAFVTLTIALASPGIGVRADDIFTHTYHEFHRTYHRNNHWPEPFIYPDRDAVVRPFAVMIAKGWQVQNTLSEHHFLPDNSRLASAGAHKLQLILTDPVAQRRMIFVEVGNTPQETMARIAAVRASAVGILPPGADVAVYPSTIQNRAWSGPEVVGVHASYSGSRKPAVLPAAKKDN